MKALNFDYAVFKVFTCNLLYKFRILSTENLPERKSLIAKVSFV